MESKDYIQVIDRQSKAQDKHEGQLTLSHGTVPCSPIPTSMPVTHQAWDKIAIQLPALIGNFKERELLNSLPLLGATETELEDKYLARASIILSSFAHAYYYNENTVPVAERQDKDPLPLCIEKPWQEITRRLRPHLSVPARTAFDSVLCNWKVRGTTHADFSTLTINDLDLLVPIVGNEEERIFFLTILLMEMKFTPALAAMVDAQSCIKTGDHKQLYRCLDNITQSLRDVMTTINIISQNSHNSSYVDPVVWAKSVIKLEESIRPGEISGSGASLPLFHIMDAFINRKYSTELGQQLLKFKKILPKTHSDFIDILGKTESSVVDYCVTQDDYRLKKKCDELLQTYEGLLTTHLVKAFGYIYLSFNIGRKRTHGGQDESAHITQALKNSIAERRKTLNVAMATATIVSNTNIGGDAHEIVLALPSTALSFRPGDKCSIYPENSAERTDAALQQLKLSGSETVQLTREWEEYFYKLSASADTQTNIRHFLQHANLNPAEPLTGEKLKITTFSLMTSEENCLSKIFKPLSPRLYSVAPIPEANEQVRKIRLTIKEIHHQGGMTGVGSSYLCAAPVGTKIKIDTAATLTFGLPKNSETPIIMFAGGTGIAPFIGFVDERASQSKANNNWLFFSTSDQKQLYYREHLESLIRSNSLNLQVIFSREKKAVTFDRNLDELAFTPDSNANGYIDKLIVAKAAELSELIINKKAHIYVCGQAKFAETVRQGLFSILLPYFNYNEIKTNERLNSLISNGSYHQDVFTRDITASRRQYSIAEVARHNDKTLWVAINNKVYDLTQFAGQHPGGEKIFRAVAGKNADASYRIINHHLNQQINSLLDSMQIGEIKPVNLENQAKIMHAQWVNVLYEIVQIENILNFGFDIKNVYQEIYLHNSVFEAFISRYVQSIMTDCLTKLEEPLGNSVSPLPLGIVVKQRLLSLPSMITNIYKHISMQDGLDKSRKLKLLHICSSLITLSRRMVSAQKEALIQGILFIEQHPEPHQAFLTQLLEDYKKTIQQYCNEIDNIYLQLYAVKNSAVTDREPEPKKNSVIIVGGGLTGIVLSAFLAKQGLDVTVYDALPDPRLVHLSENRSINITLCERGLAPLKSIGAYADVLKACVPAKGRLIHNPDGSQTTQYYGNNGESLYSVSRHDLAKTLLQFVAKNYDVKFKFKEKCLFINPDTKKVIFRNQDTQQLTSPGAALIIGADGANSVVRKTLQKYDPTFTTTKSKHHHAYKEITLKSPPLDISKNMNYLHIWPRENLMLIGFPNIDGSMTLSLHLPEKSSETSLENIKSLSDYHHLFQKYFPDIYSSIKDALETSFSHPTGHMMSMKCFPWVYRENMVLIGDAAHTLFPYYGQGANCAFEDCEVFASCYRETPDDWKTALQKYQSLRKLNSDTIIDLAAKHLHVLSTKVGDPRYQLAEKIALAVQKAIPELRTLYHYISFSTIPYREALAREETFQALIHSLMQIENIQEKMDAPEWPSICQSSFEEIIRKTPVAFNAPTVAASASTARKATISNMNSNIMHSYAGTLFFFKTPRLSTAPDFQTSEKSALFKSHER